FYDAPSPAAMETIIGAFAIHPERSGRSLAELAATRYASAVAEGAETSFRAMSDGPEAANPTAAEFAAITQQVLLVHGGADGLVSPQASVALQRNIVTAHVHIIPSAGHWIHVDQPAAFENLLIEFLQGAWDVE